MNYSIENIILFYLLGINILTFFVRGVDKYFAIHGKYRIPEKRLLYFVIAGGFLGALLGSQTFHHKTIKGSFQKKLYIIIFIQIIVIFSILYVANI